jgi:prephenate dehydrogenase
MAPHNHDAAFAAVSHLPHLLAYAYFNAVAKQPSGRDFLSLAGSGFRDFTRIAASDPTIWRDILIANKQELLTQTQKFRESLDAMEQAIQKGDTSGLEAMIRQASEGRGQWQLSTPPAPSKSK